MKKEEARKETSCPHKGEYPEREKFFSLHQTFTWRLLGFDADDLYVKCSSCGWECLIHNIDRLSFVFGEADYLPRHP